MRVLVVTNDLPPRVGGIQYYVDQLCRGLAAAGDEVVVYGSSSPGHQGWDSEAPFRVIRERTSVLLPTPVVWRHLRGLLARLRPDVVVFGAAFPLGLLGPRITREFGLPYVAFTHGLEVSAVRAPGGRSLLRRIGRDAAAITFVSGWCSENLGAAFGRGPLYELLPPAVSADEYNVSVTGSAIRARHDLGDSPVVVCVSRLVERKGQDTLVRILPELRRRIPGTRLLIVGGGPHREQLIRLARAHRVDDAVIMAGQVPESELPSHFAAGDVFAMPCRERKGGLEVEAFGIVFIQAQAVGVPVVAGDTGGVPDALRNGETGLLVDGRSDAEVLDALVRLLSDQAQLDSMGAAGARFVADGFTWVHRTAQLRAILDKVVGQRG